MEVRVPAPVGADGSACLDIQLFAGGRGLDRVMYVWPRSRPVQVFAHTGSQVRPRLVGGHRGAGGTVVDAIVLGEHKERRNVGGT